MLGLTPSSTRRCGKRSRGRRSRRSTAGAAPTEAPLLIVQGSGDHIVDPQVTEQVRRATMREGRGCGAEALPPRQPPRYGSRRGARRRRVDRRPLRRRARADDLRALEPSASEDFLDELQNDRRSRIDEVAAGHDDGPRVGDRQPYAPSLASCPAAARPATQAAVSGHRSGRGRPRSERSTADGPRRGSQARCRRTSHRRGAGDDESAPSPAVDPNLGHEELMPPGRLV